MSYTPNNWKPGDVLTAAKMNKLEAAVAQGGGGGVLKLNVDVSGDTPTLDASYNDIVAAVEAGKVVLLVSENMELGVHVIMYLAGYSVNSFIVYVLEPGSSMIEFSAETADTLLKFA